MDHNPVGGAVQPGLPLQAQAVLDGNGLQPFKGTRHVLADHAAERGVRRKGRFHAVEERHAGQLQGIRGRQERALALLAQFIAVCIIAGTHQRFSGIGIIPSRPRVGQTEGVPQFMSRSSYVNGGIPAFGDFEASSLHHGCVQEIGGVQPFLVTGPAGALVAEAAAVIGPHAIRKLADDQHMLLFNVDSLGSQHLPGGLTGNGTGILHVHSAHGLVHIGVMHNQAAPVVQVQLERQGRKAVGLHLVRIIGLDIFQQMVIPFPVLVQGRSVLERYVNHMQLSAGHGFSLMIGAQCLPGRFCGGDIPGIRLPAHGQAGKLRSFCGRSRLNGNGSGGISVHAEGIPVPHPQGQQEYKKAFRHKIHEVVRIYA